MIEKINDEYLENVSGGKIYHVFHKEDCRFGERCSLKMFPWIVTKGNVPMEGITLRNIFICEDFQTALRTELEVNLERMNPAVTEVAIDTLLHNIFERDGICAPWSDNY